MKEQTREKGEQKVKGGSRKRGRKAGGRKIRKTEKKCKGLDEKEGGGVTHIKLPRLSTPC